MHDTHCKEVLVVSLGSDMPMAGTVIEGKPPTTVTWEVALSSPDSNVPPKKFYITCSKWSPTYFK